MVLPITSISHLLAPYPQLWYNENCNDADNNNNNNNNNNNDDDDDDEDDDDDIDYVIPTEPCFNSSWYTDLSTGQKNTGTSFF